MTNETTMLAAIRRAPDDPLPRALYADWLEENGRSEEAAASRGVMLPVLDRCDWLQTFGACGGEPGADDNVQGEPEPAKPGLDVPLTPFGRKDVKRLVAHQDGDHDGPDWVAVGELWDGRFFAVRAGCDYTGWD